MRVVCGEAVPPDGAVDCELPFAASAAVRSLTVALRSVRDLCNSALADFSPASSARLADNSLRALTQLAANATAMRHAARIAAIHGHGDLGGGGSGAIGSAP